jgi:hypothetical protein
MIVLKKSTSKFRIKKVKLLIFNFSLSILFFICGFLMFVILYQKGLISKLFNVIF